MHRPVRINHPMRSKFLLLPALALALAAASCEEKPGGGTTLAKPEARTATRETDAVGKAIDLYEQDPSAANKAAADKALADLDGEIAELDAQIAKSTGGEKSEAELKRNNLRDYRAAQAARLTAFKAKAAVATPSAERVNNAGERVGDTIERGAQKTGDALDNAGRKVGDAIKDATR